jgi:hypothetical protein
LICPLAKKTSEYRFTVIGLPLSGRKPANTDLHLLICPLAEKPANTNLQLFVCHLAENNPQLQVNQ